MTTAPEPLRLTLDVACSVEHAFRAWTERLGAWWSRGHRVGAGGDIVLQGGVGGRIYEVGSDGSEHEWGRVTAWEPPHRLAFLWHLHRPVELGSEVELSFSQVAADSTRIVLVQGGWERFGEDAEAWRDRNQVGWSSVLPHFETYVGETEPFEDAPPDHSGGM